MAVACNTRQGTAGSKALAQANERCLLSELLRRIIPLEARMAPRSFVCPDQQATSAMGFVCQQAMIAAAPKVDPASNHCLLQPKLTRMPVACSTNCIGVSIHSSSSLPFPSSSSSAAASLCARTSSARRIAYLPRRRRPLASGQAAGRRGGRGAFRRPWPRRRRSRALPEQRPRAMLARFCLPGFGEGALLPFFSAPPSVGAFDGALDLLSRSGALLLSGSDDETMR